MHALPDEERVRRFPVSLVAGSLAFVLLLTGAIWLLTQIGQRQLIEFKALKVAEVVAGQTASARSVYSDMAVNKLSRDGFGASDASESMKGHIPLPAQFLKQLSRRASDESGGLYRLRPLSRWNLDVRQGLQDDFQRWAWRALEAQDRQAPTEPIDWQPVSRIETVDGVPTLRYVRADPASAASCVECHNALETRPDIVERRLAAGETPGKRWRRHELLGAMEVNVPLAAAAELARSQAWVGLLIVVAILVFGLLAVGLLFWADRSRTRRTARELARQANRDSLTGLPNRLRFERELERLLAHPIASGVRHALLLLDLDDFKQVNDTLGHGAGDAVLQLSAQRLREQVGSHGLVARLGGDEFAVLLPDTDLAAAERLASAIGTRIGEVGIIDGHRVACGTSIGIALVPEHADDPKELVRCADIAMYVAKRAHQPFRLYELTLDNHEVSHLAIVDDLRRALGEGSLALRFQPQYDIAEGRMSGAEALLRWQHPVHGRVPPDRVIEIAERSGLIHSLTDWILTEALRHCHAWRDAGFDLTVSVNLSAVDLHDRALPERVARALTCSGLDASALVLEVTESSMMKDPLRARDALDELVSGGVTISIDDYGTGYCSLSYLARLPVRELKLDRSFAVNLFEGDKANVIVEATIDMAHALGMSIVAEGVECADTLDFLVRHRCNVLQGHFLARPLSAERFRDRLPAAYRFSPIPCPRAHRRPAEELSDPEASIPDRSPPASPFRTAAAGKSTSAPAVRAHGAIATDARYACRTAAG